MLFHTWAFLAFFAMVYPVHLVLRRTRFMNGWLLLASYVFYGAWNPLYLPLIAWTTVSSWLVVRLMENSLRRKAWVAAGVAANLAVLGFYKYGGFAVENLNALLAAAGVAARLPAPDVVLPVGISFFVFQALSYVVDAYRGDVAVERSLVRFAAFVALFPQLVAGPIERASRLLPQLQSPPRVTGAHVAEGLSLFLVGFFKKVALADALALYVDRVYAAPDRFQAPALALATAAFAWQIYFDFSGYTDMARGVARAMGFQLLLNFDNPYAAAGLGDFWNRWHVSLSSWFKDYVYIPLGGNRRGTARTYVNMALTMLLSGLWHGAAWTFVVWGAIHAAGRAATRDLERTSFYRERVPRLAKQLAVFAFVCFAWIFFRAQTLGDAWAVVSGIAAGGWGDPRFPLPVAALVGAVWAYQLLYAGESRLKRVLEWAPVRVGLAAFMIAYLLVVAQPGAKPFYYFQF